MYYKRLLHDAIPIICIIGTIAVLSSILSNIKYYVIWQLPVARPVHNIFWHAVTVRLGDQEYHSILMAGTLDIHPLQVCFKPGYHSHSWTNQNAIFLPILNRNPKNICNQHNWSQIISYPTTSRYFHNLASACSFWCMLACALPYWFVVSGVA
jgi:hypothetical protein